MSIIEDLLGISEEINTSQDFVEESLPIYSFHDVFYGVQDLEEVDRMCLLPGEIPNIINERKTAERSKLMVTLEECLLGLDEGGTDDEFIEFGHPLHDVFFGFHDVDDDLVLTF